MRNGKWSKKQLHLHADKYWAQRSSYTHKDWISAETRGKMNERKNRKAALNNSRRRSKKIPAHVAYTLANKMVSKITRADNIAYLNSPAVEADEAAHHGNMTPVYANTKKLSGISNKPERPS